MRETATERHHREFAEANDHANANGGMYRDGEKLAKLPLYRSEGATERRGSEPKAQMRVTIRGKTYDSVAAAAKKFGVSLSRIYEAACRDNLDTVGTGRSRRGSRAPRAGKPVHIGTLSFPSQRAAAIALGLPRGVISRIDTCPKAHDLAMAAAMRKLETCKK